MNDNLILIGMPGSGKSTIGVVLAKLAKMSFVDIDIVIQEREGKPLQTLLDEQGVDAFLELEADAIESIDPENTVIATGGSAILTDRGEKRLRSFGKMVYLRMSYPEIERRLKNLATRGVAMREGETLRDIYNIRLPYYERIADLTVDPAGRRAEDVSLEIIKKAERQ